MIVPLKNIISVELLHFLHRCLTFLLKNCPIFLSEGTSKGEFSAKIEDTPTCVGGFPYLLT